MIKNRRTSMALLILGMTFLTIGIGTGEKTFTILSIVFVVLSMILRNRGARSPGAR